MVPARRGFSLRLASLLCLAASTLAAGVGEARAQSRQIDSVVVEQNRVIERFRPPLELQRRIGIAVTEEVPEPTPLPPEDLVLERVEIQGSTTLTQEELEPLWQDDLGRRLDRGDVDRLLQSIESRFRRADVYARAIVTEADAASGLLRIRVFEGYLEEIIVESERPGVRERLAPYLSRLANIVPLRVSELERTLLLIEDLDGITLEAQLSQIPGRLGAGRLLLVVGRDRDLALSQLDNLGSPDTGPLQLSLIATAKDLVRLHESTNLVGVLNPAAPEEFAFAQISQSVPLGTQGLRLGYSLAGVRSRPAGALRRQDVEITSHRASLSLQYPLLRRIQRNLLGRIELAAQDDEVDAGRSAVVRDRTRWLQFALTHDRLFEDGSLVAELSLTQGLDAFDATSGRRSTAGRFGGRPDFRLLAAEAEASLVLAPQLALGATVAGQFALTRLPASARFDIGNERFGRAFAGSGSAADSGIAGALTLTRGLGLDLPLVSNLRAFGFVDYGILHNDPLGADFRTASMGSVGTGIAASLGGTGFAEAVVAVPTLATRAVDERGARLLLRVGLQL